MSKSGKYSLTFDPRDWLALENDLYDPVEEKLHSARRKASVSWARWNPFSMRGLGNVASLSVLVGSLVGLFVGYPVITAINQRTLSTLGGFNLGGVNGTGQIPTMFGNYGLIDKDTPREAFTKASWNDRAIEMQLVFSDEFNRNGRTFYPGDDPYWEAADLHYWSTGNLEWYDPGAITTRDGSLVITLQEKNTHGLNYEGGLLSTWNKFCFTGGYIEVSVLLPGSNDVLGLWPAIWAMGNLGRAGYGATLEGVWPYTYDSCDVGTVANQSINGQPIAAIESGDAGHGGSLSYLPGQRLSRCTCPGEDHPGPKHTDGTFVGRSAPEIDLFEAEIDSDTLVAGVSQSAQWAPFDDHYEWASTADNLIIENPEISTLNTFVGGAEQQSTSVITRTNTRCYENDGGCYSVYGFEYNPGFDDAYITWVANDAPSWTLRAPGVGANPRVQISARPVPQEPMHLIMNLGMSRSFGPVDLAHLPFPAQMKVDYIRVYQPTHSINVGCDPKDFPTKAYIDKHIEAYTNPNFTTWVDDFRQPWPRNSLVDQC
ncbi:glycoside hydrolase family 16 protein [Coprinopsis marcescibilis]|uniref:Glycoside hydrolase family 16 protein n=1 Tax=Coprinopsis marcescibilis TaxID=230819 RepID=A0A5C3KYS9_COPMA|nr:glycoside hydrolase family 16 protein [Coprinopsis marcescibilis]